MICVLQTKGSFESKGAKSRDGKTPVKRYIYLYGYKNMSSFYGLFFSNLLGLKMKIHSFYDILTVLSA
jgi:hypothetical protein